MKLEIELDVPEGLVDEAFEQGMKEEAVVRLFAERKIPSALATRLLGLTRAGFLQLIERRGVPLDEYTAEDFRRDQEDMDAILNDAPGR
jgi:predicted HTH domain antitoxin